LIVGKLGRRFSTLAFKAGDQLPMQQQTNPAATQPDSYGQRKPKIQVLNSVDDSGVRFAAAPEMLRNRARW
jgi:hypothetical protein